MLKHFDADNTWKTKAQKLQEEYRNKFNSNETEYNEIEKSDLFFLKKKVGFATCGKPNEDPRLSNYYTGYNENQINNIEKICRKIIEKSDDKIHLAYTILVLFCKNEISNTCVFRIRSKTGDIFIDKEARVYGTWQLFKEHNTLPACIYCFPPNGTYYGTESVEFASSPASSVSRKVLNFADSAGTVVAVAGAGVSAAGCVVTLAPAALAIAGVSAAGTGIYCASRSVYSLFDRRKHEQSIGLKDKEARIEWMNIAVSSLGVGTTAAIGKAKSIAASGKSLGRAATYGLHALTTTSVIFSGYGFVDTLCNCITSYRQGQLTKKEVFYLSCELLFFFNALANAKATTKLINSISVACESSQVTQKKLTKTQKRNLRRRVAKQRAKGIVPQNLTPEESSKFHEAIFKLGTNAVIQVAKSFDPRVENILYTLQKIGHEISFWKESGQSFLALLSVIVPHIVKLLKEFEYEIREVADKVKHFFNDFSTKSHAKHFLEWFQSCSKKLKYMFYIKIMNLKDKIESVIQKADEDISSLSEVKCDDEVIDSSNDEITDSNNDEIADSSNDEIADSNDDDTSDTYDEVDLVLSKTMSEFSTCNSNDLGELSDIFEAVQNLVISEFESKVKEYTENRKAAKSAADNLNIAKYNQSLGITGDVTDHLFKKTIDNCDSKVFKFKLKQKARELKKERSEEITPVWHVVNEGIYHLNCSGRSISKKELLPIISQAIGKELNDVNCTWTEGKKEEQTIVMIEVGDKIDDDAEHFTLLLNCDVDEENNLSGLMFMYR